MLHLLNAVDCVNISHNCDMCEVDGVSGYLNSESISVMSSIAQTSTFQCCCICRKFYNSSIDIQCPTCTVFLDEMGISHSISDISGE